MLCLVFKGKNIVEKLITKSFKRLLDKGIHRGFITYEELGKSLGKRHFSQQNIELISEVAFSSDLMNGFKQKLIDYLLAEKFFDKKEIKIDDFNEKFKNIIIQTNENAPVKIIHKNKNDSEIILMFNEIIKEIEKIELRKKIESLEDKVSLNLDENLYTELLSLRNQLKSG